MITPLKRALFERERGTTWLAHRCDINDGTISEIINGKRIPQLHHALIIARAMEMTVEDLWGYILDELANG